MNKQPQRTCMGCNVKKDKRDLIRIVKNKENEISISGWVSTKGLKKFNILTAQFEDIEENEIGA